MHTYSAVKISPLLIILLDALISGMSYFFLLRAGVRRLMRVFSYALRQTLEANL